MLYLCKCRKQEYEFKRSNSPFDRVRCKALCTAYSDNALLPTLSRTTVYNTLRLLSENNAAQMITIDEHRVCYDGNVNAHAHFYCKQCRKVYDIFDEVSPLLSCKTVGGHSVDDVQLYYKGVCSECMKEKNEN